MPIFLRKTKQKKKSLSRDVIGKFRLNYNCYMQYGDFIFFGRNSIEFFPSYSRHSIATVSFHMVMSLVKSRFSHSFYFFFFSRAPVPIASCLFGWFSFYLLLSSSFFLFLLMLSAPFTSVYLPNRPIQYLSSLCVQPRKFVRPSR